MAGTESSTGSTDRGDALLSLGVVGSGTLLGVGGVMLWVGPAALLAPGPQAEAVTLGLILSGLLGLLILFGAFPRATSRALRSTVPHMFPFGTVPLDIALYVLVFAVVTCSTHAFLDVFTGADNGGQVDGLTNQAALDEILFGASVVVYLSAMYAVLLVARVVHMGRAIDQRRGLDPYRREVPDEEKEPPWIPPIGPAAPPSRYARTVLYAASVIVGLGMSAAVELLEVGLQPAPALQWLVGQAFTPFWALLTAGALAYLDRGTRTLELRYLALPPVEGTATAPSNESAA